uniref:restriction endonuclease subunit S n=1 Tax=Dialister sp. TaxID=1955814 RepID=UPI0040251E23
MELLEYINRWNSQRLGSLFREQKKKNTHFARRNAFKFTYGSIVDKPEYDMMPSLIDTYSKYTLVDEGDIVINCLNLNYDFVSQRVAIVKNSGIITSAYISLRARNADINPLYYCYYFKAMDARKMFHGMGTGIRLTLSYNELRNVPIPVPPRAEQDQIVRFLDWKVSEINKLIGIRRKEIQGLEEMKSLIINTTVTKGITESCTKSSNVPWIGEIPVDWEIIPLKRCLKNITDVDHYMPPSVAHGIPYIMTGDLKEKVSEIDFDNCKRISEQDYKALSKKSKAQHGDIVFARYATIGTVSYVDEDRDFIVSYSCVILKPDSSMIDGRYLFYYLKSRSFSEDVRQYIKINTQGNVGIDSLKRTVLTRPSIDEQHTIIKYLDTKCKKIDELIRLKQSQVQAYQELKSVIISDVVTGKIDVRNITVPEYEHVDDIADDDAEDNDEKIEEMDEEV